MFCQLFVILGGMSLFDRGLFWGNAIQSRGVVCENESSVSHRKFLDKIDIGMAKNGVPTGCSFNWQRDADPHCN